MSHPQTIHDRAAEIAVRLGNRRVVVTGGASGIGRASLREGAKVAVFDIAAQAIGRVDAPGRCRGLWCDLRSEHDVESAMRAAPAATGGVDGLVNSAGLTNGPSLERESKPAWHTAGQRDSLGESAPNAIDGVAKRAGATNDLPFDRWVRRGPVTAFVVDNSDSRSQ